MDVIQTKGNVPVYYILKDSLGVDHDTIITFMLLVTTSSGFPSPRKVMEFEKVWHLEVLFCSRKCEI